MAGYSVVRGDRAAVLRRLAAGIVPVGLLACVVIASVQAHEDRFNSLTAVLVLAAVLSGAVATPIAGRVSVSPSFVVLTLAAALLGPASAVACTVTAELTTSIRLRTPLVRTAVNLFAMAVPSLVAANLI